LGRNLQSTLPLSRDLLIYLPWYPFPPHSPSSFLFFSLFLPLLPLILLICVQEIDPTFEKEELEAEPGMPDPLAGLGLQDMITSMPGIDEAMGFAEVMKYPHMERRERGRGGKKGISFDKWYTGEKHGVLSDHFRHGAHRPHTSLFVVSRRFTKRFQQNFQHEIQIWKHIFAGIFLLCSSAPLSSLLPLTRLPSLSAYIFCVHWCFKNFN
jgi:hypothetical protein